jgi:uncharacterized protein (TIGR02302 family)
MSDQTSERPRLDANFERKVLFSSLALVFERVWPRLWVVAAVLGLFVLASLAGLWMWLGDIPHKIVLGGFGLALLASLISAFRVQWPTRDEAIRRIERTSGIAHRPASSYEDTLSTESHDPATQELWSAHRRRMEALIARLRVGEPRPRTYRFDPFALRALVLFAVLLLTALVGDSVSDRLAAAFRFGSNAGFVEARLDAWVSPPAYTGKPPLMLADGAQGGSAVSRNDTKLFEVPEKSTLIVRGSGYGTARLAIEVLADGAASSETVKPAEQPLAGDISEIKYVLKRSARVRLTADGDDIADWTFGVIPDQVPKIALTKDPDRTRRGSMKLTYKVEDDYGVTSAVAKVVRVKPKQGDDSKAWARAEPPKGPRPPLDRPPVLNLKLPGANARNGEATTYLELGKHPWAGLEVLMTLEAKDTAGQIGRTAPRRMILPERIFTKPLARAIVEQRRKLSDDPRYRPQVLKALAALTLEPEGFIDSIPIYLNLRSAYHRLERDKTRVGLNSVKDQLWEVALRIEDGALTDAERALRDAQDKLSKALEDGASEEEIKNLMQELRQAMNQYLQELQKQAAENGEQQQQGQNQDEQFMSQQDLERMMRDLEETAKNGSREQAQQMLSELRDLMDRLQAGKMNQEQQRQSRAMRQKMDELGNIVGQQKRLMDDTFNAERNQTEGSEDGQQEGPRAKGKGQQGQRGGQNGQGEQSQQGAEGGQQGQSGEGQAGESGQAGHQQGLRQRQSALRQELDRLKKELEGMGSKSDRLDNAQEAMENAERSLEQGDYQQATNHQADALDQMRQGAQQMAQEMMRQSPGRQGQAGDAPRDPLGRPQRAEGPDLGTSVKVPDAIDMQRAREILEELRKRSGDVKRPPTELDYIDRLLRRF